MEAGRTFRGPSDKWLFVGRGVAVGGGDVSGVLLHFFTMLLYVEDEAKTEDAENKL